MKKNFFLFLVLAFSLNMNAQNSSKTQEDFKVFFQKFNSDSKFQLSRITFPLYVKMNNDDFELVNHTIAKEKYKILNLTNKSEEKYLKMKSVLTKTKVTIQQRGTDNGIYIDYIFELKDNKWFLKTWIDQST